MFIPSPPLMPLASIQNLDHFFDAFIGVPNVTGGIGVFGSAAAYALVWELGATDRNPGPKTLWSINRFGEEVVLTKQAPDGYVGAYSNEFWPIIKDEISKIEFKGNNAKTTHLQIQVAVDRASQRIAALVASHAPVDTGDLASQISMIDSSDSDILSSANSESYATFII